MVKRGSPKPLIDVRLIYPLPCCLTQFDNRTWNASAARRKRTTPSHIMRYGTCLHIKVLVELILRKWATLDNLSDVVATIP